MNLLQKIEHAQELKNKAEELFESTLDDVFALYEKWAMATKGNIHFSRHELERIEDQDDCISLEFLKSYCGCCGPESEYAHIEKMFFTDFDAAVENYKKTVDERARKEAEEKEMRKQKLAEIKAAKELREFKRLKKKFEGAK